MRHAIRTLLREPGFSAAAILTIALGIGANTAIFSIVNGVLLRPLAFRQPERLVDLNEVIPALAKSYPVLPVSAWHFTEWRRTAGSFEGIAATQPGSLNLTGGGEPERLDVERVSANLFGLLGVGPTLGRNFLPGEEQDGRNRVAILSDSLWRRRFHADRAIVGRIIRLDSQPYTVVGVLPAGFAFPRSRVIPLKLTGRPEVFVPLVFDAQELAQKMGAFNYFVFGRLKEGVIRERALAELNVLAGGLEKESGEKADLRAAVTPLQESVVGNSRSGLLILLAAVGSVLLIACVNLANLALARGERRNREAAIRTALGAGRGRILRQSLAESLLIAFVGGGLGVGLAAAGLGTLVRLGPADLPRLAEVSLDGRVLVFALAVTAATGLLFGLAPAWRASRVDPQNALKAGTRGAGGSAGWPLRSTLVAAEVSLSVVLLVTGALLATSFGRLMRADKGFRASSVLATDVTIPTAKYNRPEDRDRFHQKLLEEVARQPGILSAGISTALPLQGETWIEGVIAAGDTREEWSRPEVNARFISPDYLRTMGIRLLAGRTFRQSDRGHKVGILSQNLAHLLWPGQDPIGRRVQRGSGESYEVIGVAGDVRVHADKQPVHIAYWPSWEWAPARVKLVARAAGDPRSIAAALRTAIHRVDPELPVPAPVTMQEVLEESVAQRRFQTVLASVFAATALLLAGLGIYGVVSYAVARRTGEMGLRTALGAQARSIYGLVLRQAMAPVMLGLALGLGGALALGGMLRSLLYEIGPRDPAVLAAAPLFLAGVALCACLVPARRAARVDPLVALRYE